VTNRLTRAASALAVAAFMFASCGGGAPAADPYELVATSMKAVRDPVQVNVGFAAKDGATTITVDPSAIALVIDGAGKKGAFHMALPASGLGANPLMLRQLGIGGDTIDFDVIYDGQTLYGKSPLFAEMLGALLPPTQQLPKGDLRGWLNFGTNEDFEALAGSLGGGPVVASSAGPMASVDAVTLKAGFESAGVTLTGAPAEQRNGVDANHIKVALDPTKFLASPVFDSAGTRAQLDQMRTVFAELTMSADVWLDKASSRLIEMDLHLVGVKDTAQTADVTVTFRDPDGSVSLSGPSAAVKIPLDGVLSTLLKMVGRGANG
jgi:hypothetical protein